MGCSSSMDTSSVDGDTTNPAMRWNANGFDPENIVLEFKQLDEQIGKLEAACPGSRLATIEAWIEHLRAHRDQLLGVEGMENSLQQHQTTAVQVQDIQDEDMQQASNYGNNNIYTIQANGRNTQQNLQVEEPFKLQNGVMNGGVGAGHAARATNVILANTPTKDLANLALNLGVIGDVQKASTHEDFFSNLSESALHLLEIRYYNEIMEHNRVRLKTLTEMYAELNELYINHDGIIAFISGGTYMTRLEERLDAQLETARDVRDKLGSALEQWRIAGTLLKASANSATQSLSQWKQVRDKINPKDKIHTALDCRSSLQASLVSLNCAQLALPHVEIKYVSQRQILAVKHCNVYMITDIANLSRYEHTSKVLSSFESNMSKASTWLHDTFNNSLRKDFEKAEQRVSELAKTLRLHRQEIFTAARQ